MTVRAGLFSIDGKLVHENAYDMEVFPSNYKDNKLKIPKNTRKD